MFRPASGRLIGGSSRQQTKSETSASGMLTKKIQCQPHVSVMNPPMPGPSSDESPNTAPNSPRYLPRSAGEYRSATTASATGKTAPPPRPCRPRNRMNCHISWLRPHRSDATMNSDRAQMKIGRRPYRSESLP